MRDKTKSPVFGFSQPKLLQTFASGQGSDLSAFLIAQSLAIVLHLRPKFTLLLGGLGLAPNFSLLLLGESKAFRACFLFQGDFACTPSRRRLSPKPQRD